MVCDTCDHVLMADGARSDRSYNELDPDELSPHYDAACDLKPRARDAGWLEHDEGADRSRWECPPCQVARSARRPGAA